MNLIYKLVWNSTLGAFMVASELASGKGKRSRSVIRDRRAATSALAACIAMLLVPAAALADNTQLGTGAVASGTSSNNTAIGFNAQSVGNMWDIGANGNRRVDGLGLNVTSSLATVGGVAFGDTSKASGSGSIALGGRSLASALGALATGTYANALGRNSIAHGSGSYASGSQAISFGSFSVANAARAAAFGTNATATGTDATAIGTSSTASGARAIALGSAVTVSPDLDTKQNTTDQTRATGIDSIAVGTSASAVGDDAIAMGRAASVTVKNAIAIGANASATQEGSVALGAGSTTTANLGAAAYASQSGASLAGAIAAGEVSVGSATQKRRLTNVAAGAEGTDAVNVSQLQAEASKSNATAAGIAAAIGGGAAYDADTGSFSAPSLTVGGQPVGSLSEAITHIDGRTVSNATAIDALTTNLNSGAVGLVKQEADSLAIGVAADKAGTLVNFAGTDGARTLTGVQAGAVAADSTDAINGAQLFATNANVTALGGRMDTAETHITGLDGRLTTAEGGITTLNGDVAALGDRVTTTEGDITSINTNITSLQGDLTSLDNRTTANEGNITAIQGDINSLTTNLNSGAVGLVKQDADSLAIGVAADKAGTLVNFAGTDGARILTGIKAGGQSLDAVNVAQLQAIAAGLGGGATVNADGSITGPSYSVTNADGTTHTATNLGEAIAHIDDRVADSSTKINDLDQQIKDGAVGLVKQDAATGDITVAADKGGATVNFAGTQGARTLDGIAAGAVHATSQQAVNGAQLHAASQSMAAHLGGGATVGVDGSISAPSYTVGGRTVNNVGDALTDIDQRTSQNASDISDLKNGLGDVNSNMAGINDRLDGIGNTVDQLEGRFTQLESTLSDANFGDSGLISSNVGEGNSQIALASGEGALAIGDAAVASGTNSVALGNGSIADRDNAVSVGAVGQERQVTNVAAGTQDTDAVNVAQLKQTVRYDQNADGSTDYSRVSLGQQGSQVTMSNVARGRVSADSTDAVNGAQLYDWTMNRNNQISNVSLAYRINDLERSMHAGIASAMAARQAPYVPGRVTYAVGAAGYKSQGAVGISSRYTADSGRWSLEGGFSKNGDGSGMYVGVSGVLGD